MIEPAQRRSVIRANSVRESTHPVLVESNDGGGPTDRALSIVPLMDGHQVRGIEVHCGCGSSVVIECVYEPSADAPPAEAASSEESQP